MMIHQLKTYVIALLIGGYTLYSCQEDKKQETGHVNQVGVDESKPHSHEEMEPHSDEHTSVEQHSHASPHGGTVVTAGEYHVEMVKNGNEVKFYISDNAEKAIPLSGITGKAIFQTGGKTETKDLMVHEDHLMATVDNADKLSGAIVTLRIGDKTVSAKFNSGS
ncbi:MAG: hypothetical protein K2X86_06035 [Cytophagaceae bacterium]|nr:hypothetical protein [Cytophagaceae bacterium]